MRIIDIRMETHQYTRNCKSDPFAAMRGRKMVVGAKQLKKALLSGRATHVFLAENADPALTEPIEALCLSNQVALSWVATMADLGRACGIEVGAAAAAAVD